ncbi:MAG TPA: N-acetylmuramoyl-L-alanine amidase [Chitinophagaceae bacterium]|nr:N-acetylmuramoyl-L-alanine amidase [Chitinophagaceae bacterium]
MIRFIILLCFCINLNTYGQQSDNRAITGRTAGVLPYLEYGLGADRLGGAKMTYLDTAVLLKVVDSTPVNYKVQLSNAHFAYLPKVNFRRDTALQLKPYYLTGSFLVNGDDRFDYVSISLDEKLPYRSMQLINPSKLVIDIFGATSNTNWITQRTTTKEIKNVYHEQLEDDVFRVIIELNHAQHWGYSIAYQNNKLVIRIKRQPEKLSVAGMKIAVDAGHGGDNNGAKGVTSGILEKHYTLMIAKEVEKMLSLAGANVFMTRKEDVSLGMNERIDMLKKEDPDFLISIHLNSSVKDSVKGVSTYYRYIGFRPLTQYIQKAMLEMGMADFGNVGSFNFTLSGPTEYPNCLLEVAFLSNKEDEALILDPEFHKAVATQVLCGIQEWLKACEKDKP